MLASISDPDADKETYSYDAVGRRTSMVDPNGYASGNSPADHTWNYTYDAEDRPTSVAAPPPQSGGKPLTTNTQYDPAGNRTVAQDRNNQVTKYLFDTRELLSEVDENPNAWTDPNASVPETVRTTTLTTPSAASSRSSGTRAARASGGPPRLTTAVASSARRRSTRTGRAPVAGW